MNVLCITAHLAPLTGETSLGRVVAQQLRALVALGHRVTACLPLVDSEAVDRWSLARRLSPVTVELAGRQVPVAIFDGRLPSGVELKIFGQDELFLGRPFGPGEPDPVRRAVLARAALSVGISEAQNVAVVHGFGLAGALACHLAATCGAGGAGTVLSLESLDDQGRYGKEWVERLGLGWERFTPEGFEFYGDLSLLKAGLVSADRIVLPGPSAVADAMASGGRGLEGLVRARAAAVVGILPGLDHARWNPATDVALASRYDAELLTGKASCKADLQNRLGLPVRGDVPLVAVLPPLEDHAATLAAVAERALRAELQVVAARGLARPLDELFDQALARWPDRVARLELDERAERQLLAGADYALLDAPSAAEADHLLAALRYGALPIARSAGLARDLVVDLTNTLESGNGLVVPEGDAQGLLAGIRRAVALHGRLGARERPFAEVVHRAMSRRSSWEDAARHVEEVYGEVLGLVRAGSAAEPCADAP